MWQRHTNEEADEYEIILFNPAEFDMGLMEQNRPDFFFLNVVVHSLICDTEQ